MGTVGGPSAPVNTADAETPEASTKHDAGAEVPADTGVVDDGSVAVEDGGLVTEDSDVVQADAGAFADAEVDSQADAAFDAPLADGAAVVAPVDVSFASVAGNTEPCRSTWGDLHVEACPAGQVLIGMYGFHRTNQEDPSWMLSMGGICGDVSLQCADDCDLTVARTEQLPLRGATETGNTDLPANGTAPWERVCPDNQVVLGFGGRTGSYLDQLTLRCAPLTVSFDGTEYHLELGESVELQPAGGMGGSAFAPIDCRAGATATAVRIHTSGRALNSLALGCSFPELL
jgi:hypothetical protein